MKNEEINSKVNELFEALLAYWQANRFKEHGFRHKYEQRLYDAVCSYRDQEKTWL